MCEKTRQCYPHTMTSLPNWVLWKLEDVNGRQTKVPYSALYNGKASSTNKDTWTTFDNVSRVYADNMDTYSGIGFVFSLDSRLIFIDIDHCINDGILDERASDILEAFHHNTFVEVSQSGTGLHLFVIGQIPKSFKNPHNGVEMYPEKRFVAMTGNAYIDHEPIEDADALNRVYTKYKTPERANKRRESVVYDVLSLSDNEVIFRASNAPYSGDTFRALFSGDLNGYPSQSEADFRLCQILAFWTNRDANAILRIVKSSGAYREKWERDDYSSETISRACDSIDEDLSEYRQRKQREEKTRREQVILQNW